MRVIERIVQIGYLFDMRRTFVFGIVRLCSCALQFTAVVGTVLMAAQVVRICLQIHCVGRNLLNGFRVSVGSVEFKCSD